MKIGDKCFTQGCIGEIVGQDGSECWTVMITKPIVIEVFGLKAFADSNTIYSINKVKVEPLNSEAFPIGSEVRAIQAGNCGFMGTVTGYEVESNRVICVSNRSDTGTASRQRYAYKVTEIAVLSKNYEFALNHKYQAGDGKIYRTVELPDAGKMCQYDTAMMLIEDCSGKFVCNVWNGMPKNLLEARNIRALTDMSKKNYRG